MEFENLTRVVVYDKDGDVMTAKGSSDSKLGMGMKIEGNNVMIAKEMSETLIRGWIIPMSEIGNIEFDARVES